MSATPPKINQLMHPDYSYLAEDWDKWRYTFRGGSAFVGKYLKRFSSRESDRDFKERREMSYCPAFAKSAVIEIKNAIFQRMVDVTRAGGPESYQEAVTGGMNGVDLHGSSMTAFIGMKVLPELLSMARVGVYVDAPSERTGTLVSDQTHPYLYCYRTEDIRSWTIEQRNGESYFTNLLLRDYVDVFDDTTSLPFYTKAEKFRHYWIDPETQKVHVRFYDSKGDATEDEEFILDIERIPFIIFELNQSLLADVADYQIAMLNMASSDISYAVKSNVPVYTEQADPRHTSPHLRKQPFGTRPARDLEGVQNEYSSGDAKGQASAAEVASTQELRMGAQVGRQYGPGLERPGFINPSPDPLRVSMEKQKQMKAEIRQLVHLAVTNLDVKMASAESKNMDNLGLEAGLSAIGLELETGERMIAKYWAMYETGDAAKISYPESYSLKSEQDRYEEAKRLEDHRDSLPSATFAKAMSKRIAKVLVGHHATNEEMAQIFAEIDAAGGVTSDPETISMDVERGLVSAVTASKLRGYPKGEAERAAVEHAERLARIAAHQVAGANAARGIGDAGDPDQGRREKEAAKQTDTDDVVKDKTRGKGRGV